MTYSEHNVIHFAWSLLYIAFFNYVNQDRWRYYKKAPCIQVDLQPAYTIVTVQM